SIAATSGSSETSARTDVAVPPAAFTSATVSSARSASMSAQTTRAPSPAKRSAPARPTPEPAPVTTATFPSSSTISDPCGCEPVEALGVAAQDLVLDVLRQVPDLALHHRDRVGPRRIRVRIVRLAHDVVLTDLAEAGDAVPVVDEAAVDVVAEGRAD